MNPTVTNGLPSRKGSDAESVSTSWRHHIYRNKTCQEMIRVIYVIVTTHFQLTWWRHQWKHFPRYWPFVWGIHKGQWRGALVFFFICAWINVWVNNREAGDLGRNRAHYAAIVMKVFGFIVLILISSCSMPFLFFLVTNVKENVVYLSIIRTSFYS